MEYKDYYKILGVSKTATKAEIKKAYKRLARKYHPDVSKEANAEAKFKEVNEAYEVLKSDENRASYDQFGSNWKAGQQGGYSGAHGGFSGGADFGDFFESIFGRGARQAGGSSGFGGHGHQSFQQKGSDVRLSIKVPLEDLYTGVNRTYTLQLPQQDGYGSSVMKEQRLNVKIPKGIEPGKSIRYKGKGEAGVNGGPNGDLLLKIELDTHRFYELRGRDVYLELPLYPWEAALGCKVKVPTPLGPVDLNIPKNMQSGKKMRLKGKGFPASVVGDFYVQIKIVIPENNENAEAQWQKLADQFVDNPRNSLFA
jgi:curved DNA-binding protein